MKVLRPLTMALVLLAGAARADEGGGDKGKKSGDDADFGVTYSTRMDFDSTLIDGKMKAPAGFYLQGRNKQSLSNMVNLRSNFKQELRHSRSGVKAIVH